MQPRRVRVDAETVHRGHRVGTGEAHPQVRIEEHDAVADAWRVLELVLVLTERERPFGDHGREGFVSVIDPRIDLPDANAPPIDTCGMNSRYG